MSCRIVNITLDNLGDMPPKCRRCVFWELGPVSRARAEESGDPELEKESWVSSVLLEWGSCGKIAYVDGVMEPSRRSRATSTSSRQVRMVRSSIRSRG